MKTVNVRLTIQLEVEDTSVQGVQTALDSINGILERYPDESYDSQIFVESIDASEITEMRDGLEVEDDEQD